ncbi:glucan biosynthesis protein G [Pelagicoccus sp. SDUM812002]|uniref:glucan biosynthesis protein G n=1 Tax=Pelagicoccus sp. SDUM812002 TaxID=3041266 RepID=UPI00280D6746|nr:glucan biosynthesis protein G [Pelagicoccus sp. SDUM812002]MDQ8186038.1 glucan biosynthesis protein G [Pelagicoccus sp. SDUM812002]
MVLSDYLGRTPFVAAFTVLLSGCASLDAMRRVEVDFAYVSNLAADLAESDYVAPGPLPKVLSDLDYDAYRKIRYNADKYLWKSENLPFSLGFFHPGFLHKDRVKVHEFTPTHEQHIRYLSEFFDFEDQALADSIPSSLDYAGLRLSYAVDGRSDYREIASFLGASYFRGTGLDTRYGTSARGIAIDSGLGQPEEFPKFKQVWLGKPQIDSTSVVMFALLDGPSVTGAYEFVIRPGDATIMDVKARLFFRDSVDSLGIAPLTSMFWRGENRSSSERDYRPEVHDSDGLIILEKDNEPIWRALDLGDKTRLSYFGVNQVNGFGLMQRDREFASYQDLEAEYHNRPSVWVEPKGDWGKGFIKLVELPTETEFEDNVIAFWEPAVLPESGTVLDYEYTIHWTPEPAPVAYPSSIVTSTRTGADPSYPGTEVFVVDFTGVEGAEPPELLAVVEGAARLVDDHVVWNPYSKTWRAVLRMEGIGDEGTTEARCQLLFSDGNNSEVWAYQWTR